MSVKTKSAKGETVDFDLLKIKEQIASAPAPTDVKARQSFVDKRLRRRLKKVSPVAPKIEANDEPADPKMANTEDLNQEPQLIDEVQEEEVTPTKSRQKARPKKQQKTETKE